MDLRFADPWMLLLLLALPVLALVGFACAVTRQPSLLAASRARAGHAAPGESVCSRCCPCSGLLRSRSSSSPSRGPSGGEAVSETGGEGIDIVLAYDASSSMTQPFARGQTRLQAAEQVLKRFVEGRENDRGGLVAFAAMPSRSARSQPTTPRSAKPSPSPRRFGSTTGPRSGRRWASRLTYLHLRQREQNRHLADGRRDNSPTIEPLAAARLAESLNIRVYTIGVVSRSGNRSQSSLERGRDGAPRDRERDGRNVQPRGGPRGALQGVYDSIDVLEKSRFEGEELVRYAEVASPLLALSAIVLAIELALRATVFRRAA